MITRRTGRERFTELLFYAVVILVAYLAMLVVWPFLGPLAWAGILAVTLRPVYMRFCIRLRNSSAALATTLLAAVPIPELDPPVCSTGRPSLFGGSVRGSTRGS